MWQLARDKRRGFEGKFGIMINFTIFECMFKGLFSPKHIFFENEKSKF